MRGEMACGCASILLGRIRGGAPYIYIFISTQIHLGDHLGNGQGITFYIYLSLSTFFFSLAVVDAPPLFVGLSSMKNSSLDPTSHRRGGSL